MVFYRLKLRGLALDSLINKSITNLVKFIKLTSL